MEVKIRSPKQQDYDRFSNIMDQVQLLHVGWRPDVYKPATPLITKEMFEEILKGDNWYVAEADGKVVGVLELIRGIYAREKTHWVNVFADSGCGWWRRVIAGAKSLT